MTIAIRWFAITLLCTLISVNSSQAQSDDEPLFIEANVPSVVRLNDQAPVLLSYDSSGNEVITITARNISDGDIDTVIELLYPNGERLAYNDDYIGSTRDLTQSDSALVDIVIEEAGRYTIRVNSYGNIAMGEVEVLLVRVDQFQESIEADSDTGFVITVQLPAWMTYVYYFDAEVGDVYTITARDISNQLDPYLTLLDNDGGILVENDDHEMGDITLNVFDAQINSYIIPETGTYTIMLHDFIGNNGRIELVIIRENF